MVNSENIIEDFNYNLEENGTDYEYLSENKTNLYVKLLVEYIHSLKLSAANMVALQRDFLYISIYK